MLKTHVKTLDDKAFEGDEDDVVEAYQGFLASVAKHTSRLSACIVCESAIEQHGVSLDKARSAGKWNNRDRYDIDRLAS